MALTEEQKKEKLRLILRCLTSPLFDDNEVGVLGGMGDRVSPDPEWMDYVFQRKYSMTIDEAVEKAFSYKQILL